MAHLAHTTQIRLPAVFQLTLIRIVLARPSRTADHLLSEFDSNFTRDAGLPTFKRTSVPTFNARHIQMCLPAGRYG